ncbi:MAG: hypothetical protein CBB71_01315 [Rhodopirellula sp. TMED11]|nr:MAG: hypothetical protein CBB71_01315 [Rhodopirellula sp. TMED11]
MTLCFRWASCGESLWVDELHSAWVAVGPLSEVTARAAIGNQQPSYFLGLWAWLHVFGESEIALRLSSVLASVLTSVLLAISVARTTRSFATGLLAGSFLAIDKDAIFFGCELRPYAWVMLCAAVALLCWSSGLQCRCRAARQWWWFGLVSSVCAAVLLHPTSLPVMGPFFILSLISGRLAATHPASEAQATAASRLPLICTLAVLVASVVCFGGATMQQAWSHRQRWSGFASADSWSQWLQAWHWQSMVVTPAVISLLVGAIGWRLGARSSTHRVSWQTLLVSLLPLVSAAIGITAILIAAKDYGVPLWQKRYFVAAFPLIIWTTAALFGWAIKLMATVAVFDPHQAKRSAWRLGLLSAVLVGGVCGKTLVDQGLMAQIRQGYWPQQQRGEPWRQAVSIIDEHAPPAQPGSGAVIWIDGGLIESQFMREPQPQNSPMPQALEQYLKLPVTGIYRVQEPIEVFNVYEHESWLKSRWNRQESPPKRIWLLARCSVDGVQQYIGRLKRLALSQTPREMLSTWHQDKRVILVELTFQ